ncbi:hypothetical protein [Suipraeoptans intestinalis]|nr:hypothetical protein [Suipraeoptans intestinalis]
MWCCVHDAFHGRENGDSRRGTASMMLSVAEGMAVADVILRP